MKVIASVQNIHTTFLIKLEINEQGKVYTNHIRDNRLYYSLINSFYQYRRIKANYSRRKVGSTWKKAQEQLSMCLALLRIRWRHIKATLGHISSHGSARLRVTRYLLVVYHLLVQYLPVRHLESPGLLNHTSGENANGCSLELQKSPHWTLAKNTKGQMQAHHIAKITELSQAAGSMRSIRENRKNPHRQRMANFDWLD